MHDCPPPSGEGSPSRKPHAVLDLGSRQWKALKIERLLGLDRRPGSLRLLEVGTGSGGIAHYFSTHPSGRFVVDAVDVVDNRQVTEGYRYATVTDTRLPFADAEFDVVLSNHVIEHVGADAEQSAHLAELKRVMKPDAIGYLAVPNRWMLVEPHFGLAFLSWWPRSLRSGYLRLMGRGQHYDCEPLSLRQAEDVLQAAGFEYQNLCVEAFRATMEIEKPRSFAARAVNALPDSVLAALRPAIPTLIYRFRRREADPPEQS
jgi:SAM-dependent methyltransferase